MTPTNKRNTLLVAHRDATRRIANSIPPFESDANAAFHALFDSSAEALIIADAEGVVQKANASALRLLGLKESGLCGKNLGLFMSKAALDRLKSPEAGHTFLPFSHGIHPVPSAKIPLRVTLRSILPGTRHLLLFIPVPPSADSARPLSEAEVGAALNSVQSGILILDPSGNIRFWNAPFGRLFGIDPEKLRDTENLEELNQLLTGQLRDLKTFTVRWSAFLAGNWETTHDELELAPPLARVLDRVSRPILRADGQPLAWLEIYTDVTERRLFQSNMLQTEKMVALGQVVSGIAHELNNPLTAIMGYIQLLLGHGLAPSSAAEARKVYQEAERARRIVKNLLYFARENKPQRSAVDINELIERTVALRSYELKVENILIETDFAAELPRTMADPYQLQQVVLNLLINSEQALLESRGNGRVHISTRCLVRKSGNRVLFEVSDDGPGIPREIVPRIFDPFFTTKGPGIGTGLGLSIVYGIVRQHDGDVTFRNQLGSGAKFSIEFPLVPVPAGYRAENPVPLLKSHIAKPARILVVEDEPTVSQLIADVLQEERHSVDAVSDGREALNLLSRCSYDLVICDLRMPRFDGRAFFRSLVRTGNPMCRRILFITGDTLAPATLRFLKPNRLPYLAKPFLVEELKLAVRQQLDIHRRRKTRARPSRNIRAKSRA